MKRLLVIVGLLAALGTLAACGGAPEAPISAPTTTEQTAPSAPGPVEPIPAPTASVLPTAAPTAAQPTAAQPTATPATTRPTAAPTTAPASSAATVSLPPNLCAATDRPQDTADAFMGSLSAGQVAEASKCVLPAAVPAELVASLAGTQRQTAGYAPVGGGDGPVFTYRGAGKTVLVTVTRQADGTTWVTGLEVR